MILDRQGRLLGKISLVDLLGLLLLLSLAGSVWYGIQVSRYGSLQIFSVEPKRIVAGSGTHLTVKGTGFDSSTTLRLGDYPDWGTNLLDGSTIGVEIRKEVNPGLYRVVVRDSRGRYAVVPGAVEVVWIPRISEITPRIIYPASGEATRIEVRGDYFTPYCSVRVGDREFDVLTSSPDRILAALNNNAPPLPLGPQTLTVINRGGPAGALERALTVVPAPKILSVEPRSIAIGEDTDLLIQGNHLRDGTMVTLDRNGPLGEASLIRPDCLRLRVIAQPGMAGTKDLMLQPKGGPNLTALARAVEIRDSVMLLLLVDIELDKPSGEALNELRQFPEWRWRRPLAVQKKDKNKGRNQVGPRVEVLLPAIMKVQNGVYQYLYRGKPLRKGDVIETRVYGRDLAGVLVEEPYTVFTDEKIPR